MNNGVLLCEQLFPMLSKKDEIVLFIKSSTPVPDCYATVLGISYIAPGESHQFLDK